MSEDSSTTMRIDPRRAEGLLANLQAVTQRIEKVQNGRKVRLIAVSKLKPANDILALHRPASAPTPTSSTSASASSSSPLGHLDFGENYAQELTSKAALLPSTIRWHMLGALQTNKCKPLAEHVANLYCVSSVDSAKKADALEKGRAALAERLKSEDKGKAGAGAGEQEVGEAKLRVLVQVNTSGEASKSGVEPSDTAALCAHIRAECPHLRLAGLMTIGAIARSRQASTAEEANEDFEALKCTRKEVAGVLGVAEDELELSMGMSADFEAAVVQGSDEVRVGTGIFGERGARSEAVIQT